MPKLENITPLIGKMFGRLMIISDAGRKQKIRKVLARCSCNKNEKEYELKALKTGHTQSCGCLQKETMSNKKGPNHPRFKHGLTSSDFYHVYRSMINRCYDTNQLSYKYYGAKKITVCERWLKEMGFINFYEDMFVNYKKGLTIERINSKDNYCLENCRWATYKEQNRNKSNNRFITFNNKTKLLCEWAESLGLNPDIIYMRLDKLGWTIERTLNTPIRKYKKNP